MNHIIECRNRHLRCMSPYIVVGGVGTDTLQLDLDTEWDGSEVHVVLTWGDTSKTSVYDGEPLAMPTEQMEAPGWLSVSLIGYGDGTRLVTAKRSDLVRLVPCGETGEVSISGMV